MTRRRTIVIGTILVIAALAAVAFYVTRSRSQAAAAAQYETIEAEQGDLTSLIGATGTVRANQTGLLSWQTSGTVGEVTAKVGDLVKEGDSLAGLEPATLAQNIILARADLVEAQRALDDLLESQTATAQAQVALLAAQTALEDTQTTRDSYNYRRATQESVENAQANLALAQDKMDEAFDVYQKFKNNPPEDPRRAQAYTTYYAAVKERDRAQATLNWLTGGPTSEDISEADANLALAQAQYDDALRAWERLKDGPNPDDIAAAQARVDAIQAALRQANVIAPFRGTITEAQPLRGDQVNPGTPAFRIDDLNRLFVEVPVSEVDINNVKVGQPVTLTFDAITGEQYNGQVSEVGQVGNVTQGAVDFTVTVEVTDPDEMVKPSMTAAVSILVQQLKDVLTIPNRAVRFVDGERVVYILRDGEAVPVKIELGASSDVESEVIGGDLEAGDLIILNPPTIFGGPGGGPGGGGFGGGD
jgi:HlyD family secretion protein